MNTMGKGAGRMCLSRLRENIWRIVPDQEVATLITSRGFFSVSTPAALTFLQMRSYCTGHHSIEQIAERSGLSEEAVRTILDSLDRAGLVISMSKGAGEIPSNEEVRSALTQVCELWSRELQAGYIGNEFIAGHLSRESLVGWLVEMYHYIRDFPEAIDHAASRATGRLKAVLMKYADEERGHEEFVLQTLANLGLSRDEVVTSAPLLSTRLIGFLMRELFSLEPAAALLVAALVEAQEYNDEQILTYKSKLGERYGLDTGALDPYFAHQAVDVRLGHAQLLSANIDLIEAMEIARLDQIVNNLHDVKHAFDLQSLEIKSYYNKLDGKYLPRQSMQFAAI